MSKHAAFTLALALCAAPAFAGKPTATDITDARAQCRADRLHVAKLEASGTASKTDLAWERSAWDRDCAYAERLMVDAGLEKPSPPPVAPAPVPQLVITQRKADAGAEFASAPAATQASAEPSPAPKPAVQLKQWHVDELIIREPVRLDAAPPAPAN